jgi:hypothetical protein
LSIGFDSETFACCSVHGLKMLCDQTTLNLEPPNVEHHVLAPVGLPLHHSRPTSVGSDVEQMLHRCFCPFHYRHTVYPSSWSRVNLRFIVIIVGRLVVQTDATAFHHYYFMMSSACCLKHYRARSWTMAGLRNLRGVHLPRLFASSWFLPISNIALEDF